MLRGQCWELGKEPSGVSPPEGVHPQVPRDPHIRHRDPAAEGPVCGEQWLDLTGGAEDGVFESQSCRGAR